MCRKLFFLTTFVLVLALSSTAFHKFHDYATFLFLARGLPV
jgi:hypothetical protein